MNRIRLLPEKVANQIAAGEVVERPASIVKELVENAIDADATRITVEIEAGGRSMIRVTDDGVGMSRDDALLCLERHATSKIQLAEDLAAVSTMGFRGEALPSISSVSRFTLTTRERDSEASEATQITIHGGKILSVTSASGPPGTSVEVRQVFYNLPARRKFLKTQETERSHIQHYLLLAAIAYPEVGFTYYQGRKLISQIPPLPVGDTLESRLECVMKRMKSLYASDFSLLPVSIEDMIRTRHLDDHEDSISENRIGIWGFIGAPGVSRSTRNDQHLFVNRRPIENRSLNFALLEGYHTALMKGRYPVCCLFLELDPAFVDVNVHPAKREVKFHNERAVRQILAQAVRKTLLDFHSAESDASPAPTLPSQPAADTLSLSHQAAASPQPAELPNLGSSRQDLIPQGPGHPIDSPNRPSGRDAPPAADSDIFESQRMPSHQPSTSTEVKPSSAMPEPTKTEPHQSRTPTTTPLLQVPLRLVGVIGKLYVILESDRGLVLLDQHAAHERVLFEQMMERLEKGPAPSQRLLLPETVELGIRDSDFVKSLIPTLTRLGVGLSEFGERTFLLDALPPFVKSQDSRNYVLQLIDDLQAAGNQVNTLRLGEEIVAKTVCRHAVKANDPLHGAELEQLVKDLRHCTMPYTCPHGRPTLVEMPYRELEKKFGRIA